MVCVGLTITGVLYQAGEDATDAISQKALVDMISRIHQGTEQHLLSAHSTLKSVAPDLASVGNNPVVGAISFPEETSKIEERLWVASDLFPDMNRHVYFGGADGRFVGVNRSDPDTTELRLKEANSAWRNLYHMAGPGSRLSLSRTDRYEPRERPWYRSAVVRGGVAWSPVYNDFSSHELVLTLAKPVYRADRSLIGVAATDLPLQRLTMFLQSLIISPNGIAFIAEREGGLVATSALELPYKIEKAVPTRLMARESAFPLIREAYRDVTETLRVSPGSAPFMMRSFKSELGKIQLAAMTLPNEKGLDWIIVVAVPRSDFMSNVTRNLYRSLSLGMIAMCLALVLGFVILRWALRDIRKLTLAARSISSGQPFAPLNIDRNDEIGQLAQSFEEMERNLRTDRLTHVLNRESFISQIEFRRQNASLANPLHFSLLFIDLDNFKTINDEYGHDCGDRALVEIGARLQSALRKEDAVARFGGDEFVVYLHGVNADALVQGISDKIRAVVEEPITVYDGIPANVGASIGSAHYPADGEDIETLFRVADLRMFESKRDRKTA
ncbi:sensor domain-containing diguanylate cyclase [Noviherbaspirillum cavernae]|uniref:Sensor domain-containing diguanylate cyclase n=1 Tax=Noviherbaspirillum cavernae TaxID=2320862 RepID=A0A418X1H7_9BURK|nr:sensor domain-containing diguanylate cyclase [Noviherbaspirillum cavernae]RJG06309.1 sensor domain-containing diguanylate cyclase [Noviherbaspirillum cavernae]